MLRISGLLRKFLAVIACLLGAGVSLPSVVSQRPGISAARVSIVVEGDVGAPGEFGVGELAAALRSHGATVDRISTVASAREGETFLVGIATRSSNLRKLGDKGLLAVPPGPESFAISPAPIDNRRVIAAGGSDERGLMYALTELARRISHLAPQAGLNEWFASQHAETGKPAVSVRGMIQFLHSADLERSWYYDREYWKEYLGMLARDRFNSLNLVFAHQTSYLAPPYPFLFDVEEYPQVKVPGLSTEEQRRNLETLQMISHLARERGIDFIMGIWEQRAWNRGQTSMVAGLTDDILTDYARLAMRKLLRLCPDIAGIQLRVNPESGIEIQQQTAFYRDGVLAGMKAADRPVLLDLRGWGALPETIEAAAQSISPLRLSMKYWAEFMGMPYQPARMLPSYSYADFLRYPRRFPVLYQVWSLGSHRLLPWGSVDWMKRFAATTQLGDGIGFETCAPLSQKGFGNAPGDWRIFTSAEREYCRWEFQRYWLYYLLYGRLTYDAGTSDSVWMDEFRSRFGEKAAPEVFAAFQSASEVIPFMVSYRLSNPNMYIWPEKQMGGLLDFYLEVKPADEARFAGFQEYADIRLHGVRSAKMMPEEASRRLTRMADDTERALSRADRLVNAAENKEYAANRIDLSVLALLARYHARKILAAAHLELFYRAGDESALHTAAAHGAAGLELWERLARLTDGVFTPNMVFGPQDVGHWKDNLVFVRHDVSRLGEVLAILNRYELFDLGLDFGPKVEPRRSAYEPQYANSYTVERRFRLLDPEMTYTQQRGYGWLDTAGITASPAMSVPYASLEGDNLKDLALPSEMLYRDFLRGSRISRLAADLPDGDYRITAIVANRPELAGGSFQIRATAGTIPDSDPIHFALAETGDKSMNVRVSGGRLALDFVPQSGLDWLVSGLVVTRRGPHIGHIPTLNAVPGSRSNFAATITAPDGIAAADLHLDAQGERVYPLLPHGRQFTAEIEWLRSWQGKSVSYFISAVDKRGHSARLPADGGFRVLIGNSSAAPVIEHQSIQTSEPGKPLNLTFTIRASSPIAMARLRYRHLTQMEDYLAADLVRTGDSFEATIPGDFITPNYDIMYYVEAADVFGKGSFYPDPDRTAPYVTVKIRR